MVNCCWEHNPILNSFSHFKISRGERLYKNWRINAYQMAIGNKKEKQFKVVKPKKKVRNEVPIMQLDHST